MTMPVSFIIFDDQQHMAGLKDCLDMALAVEMDETLKSKCQWEIGTNIHNCTFSDFAFNWSVKISADTSFRGDV